MLRPGGIQSLLRNINDSLLNHVAGQQVRPVMEQIQQLLTPFIQGQGPGMGGSLSGQGLSTLNMSPAFNGALTGRTEAAGNNMSIAEMSAVGFPTPQYMPMDQGNGQDQFGRPMQSQIGSAYKTPLPTNTAVPGSAGVPLTLGLGSMAGFLRSGM